MIDEDEFETLRRDFAQAHAMWRACESASLPVPADRKPGAHLERLSLAIARHPVRTPEQLRVKVEILRVWLLDHLVSDAYEDDPSAIAVRHLLDDVCRLQNGAADHGFPRSACLACAESL